MNNVNYTVDGKDRKKWRLEGHDVIGMYRKYVYRKQRV